MADENLEEKIKEAVKTKKEEIDKNFSLLDKEIETSISRGYANIQRLNSSWLGFIANSSTTNLNEALSILNSTHIENPNLEFKKGNSNARVITNITGV